MRIPGARRARLTIFISLAALAVTVGWLLTVRTRALYRNIGPLMVAELERQLGREVIIGRVDTSRLGRVVLSNVAVAEEDRLARGVLFRAPRITFRYSWRDLLWFRTDVAGSVRQIEIEQPYLLLVRDRTGKLNLQQLFKPKPGARPTRFRAVVLVTGGRLKFRDYKASLPRLPAENEVADLNGRLDYRTYPRLTAQVAGTVVGNRAGPVQANTWIDTSSGRWLLRSYASDADAAYWVAYLLRTPMLRVQSGRANADLVVSRTGAQAPLEYVVNLAATGVGVRVARLGAPIHSAGGVAQITPYGVKLEASGSVAGMRVQVNGNILDWKKPQVALSARGSGLTLAGLRRLAPQVPALPGLVVDAPARAEAWILGPATRLYATGSLAAPSLRYRETRVRDARVVWHLHSGMLQLDQITAAAAAGGALHATGWLQYQPGPPHLYVTGSLDKVNLAGLPGVPRQASLRGEGDVRFAVSGPLRDLHGGASVQLSRMAYDKARLDSATARLDYQAGILYVRSLRAADRRGRLVAAGTVGRRGNLDLEVRAKGVDLALLLAPFVRQPASGTAYFTGQVRGTTRDPRLVGDIQLYAAQFGKLGADYAEGKIVLQPDRVSTPKLALRVYPGELTVSGAASGWRSGHPQARLTASMRELSLTRLLTMAEARAQVAGTLSGSLTFQGDPTRLIPSEASVRSAAPPGWRAVGNIRVDDLLVEGATLGTARARLEVEGTKLWIRQASVEGEPLLATATGSIGLLAAAPGATRPAVAARGWVTSSSPLDLSFAIERLDLAAAATRAGSKVLLQGTGQLREGKVSGTLGSPVVTAQLEAAPLTVNGVTFTRLAGSGSYNRDRIALRDVVLRENGGSLMVRAASVQPRPKKPTHGLTVDAEIASFPLQRLIELARNSASVGGRAPARLARGNVYDAQGTVSGSITARPVGTEAGAPTLWTAALNAPAVTLAGYRIAPAPGATAPSESVPLTVGLEARATYTTQGRLTLDRLAVSRDEGLLLARGTMVQEGGTTTDGTVLPQGRMDLQVDATEIPIGLFGPLAPSLHPLAGDGELHMNAEGPIKTPTIRASMDVDRFTLGGVPFSHFAVPFLQIGPGSGNGPGSIAIENARLELDAPGTTSAQHVVLVNGTLPFLWKKDAPGFLPQGGVPGNDPLTLSVRLPKQGLEVFNRFAVLDPKDLSPRVAPLVTALGSLSAISGSMSGDLSVTGTPARFNSSGSFSIENGAFQPQKGQTRFDQIAVRLGFVEDRIQVQQFEGRSSDGGRFQGGGEISDITLGVGDQPPSAKLNLTFGLNDLGYRARNLSGYFQERFRGTIRTVDTRRPEEYAPLQLTGDWRSPRLAGAVQFRRTNLAMPASLPEASERAVLPPINPTFNLDVILGKDVWLESSQMRMQLAGRLPIRGTLASPNVRGTLVVERGTIAFPTALFRVEGAVEVTYAPGQGAAGGLVPLRVDLTATSRVRGADPNTGQRQRYELTLQITGPLSADAYQTATTAGAPGTPSGERLRIEATSDPPLSEAQILALLGRGSAVESVIRGGGDTQDVLRREIADTLVSWGAPSLFVPLQTKIEDWLGLEEFSIDFALQEPVQLRMTKQLKGSFYATYTQSLAAFGASVTSPTPGTASLNLYSLELYYRFSNRLRLGYRIEEPSNNHVLLFNTTLRF